MKEREKESKALRLRLGSADMDLFISKLEEATGQALMDKQAHGDPGRQRRRRVERGLRRYARAQRELDRSPDNGRQEAGDVMRT